MVKANGNLTKRTTRTLASALVLPYDVEYLGGVVCVLVVLRVHHPVGLIGFQDGIDTEWIRMVIVETRKHQTYERLVLEKNPELAFDVICSLREPPRIHDDRLAAVSDRSQLALPYVHGQNFHVASVSNCRTVRYNILFICCSKW